MAVRSGDGDNVSSTEMEDVLFRHRAVREAAVERLPTSGAGKVFTRRRCEPHWQGHETGVGGR